MVEAFKALFRSRKFLVLAWDVVTSLLLYFLVKYAAPELTADITFVIEKLQLVYATLIGAIALEDAAAKRAGIFPK